MEAVALYSFDATDSDELSFKKGDIVKIVDMDSDPNWYKGECGAKEGLLPKNYVQLKENSVWYIGNKSRQESESFLLAQPHDGAFVVRKSETTPGDFSLSVRFEHGVQHFKVLRDGGKKYFLWLVKFDSLNQLVDYHRTSSVSRNQQIYLKDPVLLKQCVAKFDFARQEDGELSFTKGQKISILDNSDQNWWKGKIGGQEGIFPASYVELVKTA